MKTIDRARPGAVVALRELLRTPSPAPPPHPPDTLPGFAANGVASPAFWPTRVSS